MNLHQGGIFHCYNRGNNKQIIFFSEENYIYFLRKIRTHIYPHCNVLSYCLMPNHFHLMIHIPLDCDLKKLTAEWRIMLSSYTRAINKHKDWSGSLFQQKTKSKEMKTNEQALICFNYIHQNPIKSGLVSKMEDWKFSSFMDYVDLRGGTLVAKKQAFDLIDLPIESKILYDLSYKMIPSDYSEIIF
jgi:putative transposase